MDDEDVSIIKSMIKNNEGLPNVWARLLLAKIEVLHERTRRLEEVLHERTRRLEVENEALKSQLNSSMFYLFIFITCFICFIYLLLFFFSFSKRC